MLLTNLNRLFRYLVACACLFGAAGEAMAQALVPFTCDVVFYQIRNKNAGAANAQSLIVKFAAVNPTVTPTAVYTATQSVTINAIGYNPVDNFMYGILFTGTAGNPSLYRIGQDGYALVGPIAQVAGGLSLATFLSTAGAFDAAGRYYFSGQVPDWSPPAVFRVDAIPPSGTVNVSHQYRLSPTFAVNPGDFDFNGAGGPDGLLLAATGTTLFRVNLTPSPSTPSDGTASLTTLTLPSSVGAVGSAFWDAATAKFYVFDNALSAFNEVVGAESSLAPSVVGTSVPAYNSAPLFPPAYSPTDGSSCPISGTRRADLAVTKSDGVGTVTNGAVTAYTITVKNNGPYPANYSVVRDPAAPGLQKLSVTCSAPGGPPSAVCPPTLSTATLEAGVSVTTFPPGSTLVFTVNALVTGLVGTTVTNTVTASVALDTTDTVASNNTAVDADRVVGNVSRVVSAPAICPANTLETLTNRIANATFNLAASFSSDFTVGANNTYQVANSVTRQVGTQAYGAPLGPNAIVQYGFPGDATRSVAGSPNWLLANGKTAAGTPRVWYQAVTGLTVGATYEFMVYVSNATLAGSGSPTVPSFRMDVQTTTLVTSTRQVALSGPIVNESVGIGTDTWTLVQGTFTAQATAATVSIASLSLASAEPGGGDVLALAQATLRECRPAANVRVSKTNGTNTVSSFGTTSYTVTVTNPSIVVASNTLIVDPAATGLIKTSITCVASAGAVCPAALTVLAFEGVGLVIPTIGAGGQSVTFRVNVNVTGLPGTTATNTVNVSSNDYADADLSDNAASDADAVIGRVNFQVTKDNAATTLVAGSTTSYTITVANFGPSSLPSGVLTDTPQGLSCTAVTCTLAIGAATCPAPGVTTIVALTGAGITLPTIGAPASLVFRVDCNVIATGFN